jgi:hypothetical protein
MTLQTTFWSEETACLDRARLHTKPVRQGIDRAARRREKAACASTFSLMRVMRHAICLFRRPSKAAFFLAGIRRELTFQRVN